MATPNFVNRTMWTGDNLPVLRGLNSESVDLIYLDPPFNSNRTYAAPIGSKAAGAAFKDTWTLSDVDQAWHGEIAEQAPSVYAAIDAAGIVHGPGMKSYLIMMAVRLLELRRVLKPTGSFYLHCDLTANSYLRLLCDAVFGSANLRNEIVWHYRTSSGVPKKHFIKNTDTIFFYVKTDDAVFTIQREPWPETTLRKWQRDATGIYRMNNGKKYYIDPNGKRVDNLWDITLSSRARERVGYPTQKPLALLDRIIKASTNAGDVVLDAFAGCATACVSAESLHRQWIGIDLSPLAGKLVVSRLNSEFGMFVAIHHRTDIPQRTDLGILPHYRTHKHRLFGQQEGTCNGCQMSFQFRMFEVDHVIPRATGGTHHFDNLQLLCPACNRAKGTRSQAELLTTLRERGMIAA